MCVSVCLCSVVLCVFYVCIIYVCELTREEREGNGGELGDYVYMHR